MLLMKLEMKRKWIFSGWLPFINYIIIPEILILVNLKPDKIFFPSNSFSNKSLPLMFTLGLQTPGKRKKNNKITCCFTKVLTLVLKRRRLEGTSLMRFAFRWDFTLLMHCYRERIVPDSRKLSKILQTHIKVSGYNFNSFVKSLHDTFSAPSFFFLNYPPRSDAPDVRNLNRNY